MSSAAVATPGQEQVLRDAIRARASSGFDIGDLGQSVVPRDTILNYKLLPLDGLPASLKPLIYRANSLMDMYFFGTVVLGRNKLSKNPDKRKNLHYIMCLQVMKDGLKEGIEIPRDHLKTTIYVEIFGIWRALPFGPREADFFSNLGYSDLYIEWMFRTHSQDIRILFVSETIKNAVKLGTRISNHYENNRLFRELFFDILPTERDTWTADSLHQRRTLSGRGQGEGTFDFIGVGAALQSRHYNVCVQDDLVGREARKSAIVMADTIDYHQVLVGATDNDPDDPARDFDEIVVGNRWSTDDLNSYIRREEKYFSWTTHSALGGCCGLHPFGEPIYPEAFTKEKLLRWKHRLGSYHFSCQFLNFPIDPAKKKFNLSDFRYFNFEKVTSATFSVPKEIPWQKTHEISYPQQSRWVIRHHVAEGDVEHDVFPRYLDRYIITDPRHSDEREASELGTGTRCRHAIIVVGISEDPRRVYLLDQWAEACSTGRYIGKILHYAIKWKLLRVHCEAIASQKFLITHFNYYVSQEVKKHPELEGITMVPLKTFHNADAKFERIENTIPMVERHEVWLDANNCSEFREEAEKYGQSRTTVDLLDCFGYVPVVAPAKVSNVEDIEEFLSRQKQAFVRGMKAVG